MFTKVLIIFFKGVALFARYFKSNILSLLALTGLFLVLHMAFSFGNGVSNFANKSIKFDTIRVYAASFDEKSMKKIQESLETFPAIMSVSIYSPQGSKAFMVENVPTISSLETLPDELFPAFFDVLLHPGYHNVTALKGLAEEFSKIENVKSVSYGEEWAVQVERGKSAVSSLLFIAVILFATVGVVILSQIINIGMYKYRHEIKVYNVVGGTKAFILLPFVVLSLLISIFCMLCSFILYLIIKKAFFVPIEKTVGMALNLSSDYVLFFLIMSSVVAIVAGYVSAYSFLGRVSSINED